MFKLSDTAATKIKEVLIKNQKPDGYLRVSITSGGCAGFEYELNLDDAPREKDFVIEGNGGAKVLLDGRSSLYLSQAELQWKQSLMKSGFEIVNPLAKVTCKCGESFSFDPNQKITDECVKPS